MLPFFGEVAKGVFQIALGHIFVVVKNLTGELLTFNRSHFWLPVTILMIQKTNLFEISTLQC